MKLRGKKFDEILEILPKLKEVLQKIMKRVPEVHSAMAESLDKVDYLARGVLQRRQ